MSERIFCFAPVADARARVLVLGTMPSVRSLEQGFYYANPRNAFWPMLQSMTGRTAQDAEQRRALALDAGVALWDVLASCEREGSLDSAIRSGTANDIAGFLRKHAGIRAVICNGGTAWRLYRRHCAGAVGLPAMALPSTSPAYTMPYAQKLALWSAAFVQYGVPIKENR